MIELQLRGNAYTKDRRLDRVEQFDERSHNFPIKPLLSSLPKKRRGYHWGYYPQLDQGREGACTGFSRAMEAAARPGVVSGITDAMARSVYYRARQLDPWAGEDYEGSSVLAAMKASTELGWYGLEPEYRWAFNEDEMAMAVAYRGPVVVGTAWYEGMYNADKDGYLRPTGQVMGGHAYLVPKYSTKKDGYWIPNSWGGSGQGWIHREDMVTLLRDNGECCINTTRRKVTA